MYRKRYISSILSLLFFANISAQTMRDVVKQIPDTIVPLLTRNNLLDFPDYIDSQMRAELTNRLGGTSEMQQLTDDYTSIKLNGASTLQLKLLPQGKKKIVCLVRTYTVNDSIGDSQIQFYTTEWKPLPTKKYLNVKPDGNSFMQATLAAETTDITLRWNDPLSISFDGDSPKKPANRPSLLKWNGKQYLQEIIFF